VRHKKKQEGEGEGKKERGGISAICIGSAIIERSNCSNFHTRPSLARESVCLSLSVALSPAGAEVLNIKVHS